MKQTDMIRMNFDIPITFREQLRSRAKEYGMTSAQYCRMVLMQAVGGAEHGRRESDADTM